MQQVKWWVVALLVVTLALPGVVGVRGSVGAQNADPVVVAQAMINSLVAGEYEAAVADFTPDMREALPAETLGETWESVIAQVGAFVAQRGVETASVDGSTIVTAVLEFENALLDAQVSVDAAGQVAGFYIRQHEGAPPPAYDPPAYASAADQIAEREVTLNAGTEWELPGTLTLPVGDGPFPAVVLVHGSGAHDRDETIGPNKPFRDLALGLAAQEIALLRYEKRTLVHGSAMVEAGANTVQEETIADALAAVALLRETEPIDPARVFVIGHSLGGYLAPRIAAQAPDGSIAGLVIMAGNARPLPELMLEQVEYLLSLEETVPPQAQEQIDAIRAEVAALQDVQSAEDAPQDSYLGVPVEYWLDLRAYDPVATAQSLDLPMLIAQGERDYQVTLEDFEGWQAGLAERDTVRFETYPALNHLFMAGEGQPSPQEYAQPGHVDPAVIDDIATWILSF